MPLSLKRLAALAACLLLANAAHGTEETTWAKIKAETFSPQPSAKSANAAIIILGEGIQPGVDADGNFGVICPPDDGGEPQPCGIDESIAGPTTTRTIVNKAKVIATIHGQVTNLSGKAANFSNKSTGFLFGVDDPDVLNALFPDGPLPIVVLTDKWHTTVSASGQARVQATFSRDDLFAIYP